MAFGYIRNFLGINIVPKSSSNNSAAGDLEFLNTTGELYLYNGVVNSPLLTAGGSFVIQNKTIDITNTVQLLDSNFSLENASDHTKVAMFSLSGLSTSTTRVYGLPDGSDTLVGLSLTQTLTNKTLGPSNIITTYDGNFTIENSASPSKAVQFSLSGLSASVTRVISVPDANLTLVGTATAQTLTNKTVVDNSFTVQNSSDATKQAQFSLAALSTSTTRTYSLPNANTTLVGTDAVQTLTNKTINAASNSISNVTVGDMSSGAATNGQVATADGSGNVMWNTPTTGMVKNYLLNSNFDFWQRGTNFVSNGSAAFGPDRWAIDTSTGAGFAAVTVAQVVGSTQGAKYGCSFSIVGAASTSQPLYVCQTLENLSSILLYNQTASFGINIKALGNVNQVGLQFLYQTTETSITGGSATAIGSEVLVSVNTSTFTFGEILGQALGTAQTKNGVIGVQIRLAGVSSGNIYANGNGFVLEQAMLNVGSSVATYARAGSDLADELLLCQRFYWQVSSTAWLGAGYFNTSTQALATITFPTSMRIVPTPNYSMAGAILIARAGTSNATGSGSFQFNNTDMHSTQLQATAGSASTTGFATTVGITSGGGGYFVVDADL